MNHGSLFSGIGGFDLASEWMGWNNIFHCEWNPFGQRILKHYWPKAISYEDTTKTDFTIHRGSIDILTGGFPCQPYSQAGKRLGKKDDRHLWPEMLRAIREIQPSWVVGENVLGIVNWNGGMVFDEVQADLEAQGYEVQTYVLPAVSVNAPHRRDRVWFVAYSERVRFQWDGNLGKYEKKREIRKKQSQKFCNSKQSDDFFQKNEKEYSRGRKKKFENFPSFSPICDGDDGLSSRLDGITFSKWRNESIKGGGNAIVPQVALQIFKSINQYNQINHGH